MKFLKLTYEQKKHLETLKWLVDVDKNAATGRTTLLAIAFLETAFENPNKKIYIFDHCRFSLSADINLIKIIKDLLPDQEVMEKMKMELVINRMSNTPNIMIKTNN